MPFTAYVLESESPGRLYVGQTSNLARRLEEHRSGRVVSTRRKGPWRVLHLWNVKTRTDAVRLERRLKAMKNPARVREAVAAARR